MREMMKKTLSVCLALLMLLSCFAVPTTAFAAAPKKPTVSSVSAGAAAFIQCAAADIAGRAGGA